MKPFLQTLRRGSLPEALTLSLGIHAALLYLAASWFIDFRKEDSVQTFKIQSVLIEPRSPPAETPPTVPRAVEPLKAVDPAKRTAELDSKNAAAIRTPGNLPIQNIAPAKQTIDRDPGAEPAKVTTATARPAPDEGLKATVASAVAMRTSPRAVSIKAEGIAAKPKAILPASFLPSPAATVQAASRNNQNAPPSPRTIHPIENPEPFENARKRSEIPPSLARDRYEDLAESAAPVQKAAYFAEPRSIDNLGLSGEELEKIRGGFLASVREKVSKAKRYPKIARDRGFEGEPVVAFSLGKDGALLELSLDQPSAHDVLNQAALQTVRDATPYPPIPRQIKEDVIKLKLPILFVLE